MPNTDYVLNKLLNLFLCALINSIYYYFNKFFFQSDGNHNSSPI